jgi:predicted flap endonuclease-1-like 5' DNA nuclease
VFSVKGLSTDPVTFNGVSNTIAIIEILFMTLGAFLIGFLAAYYLQEEPIKKWRIAFFTEEHEKKELQFTASSLRNEKKVISNEKSLMELQYKSELAEKSQRNQLLNAKVEESSRTLESQKQVENQLKQELDELRPRAERLGAEVSHLRFKVKQLEFENQNKTELRVPKEDEISDLTEIQGIGPAISRKLYAMGIYSFKQISQFDQKTIDQIGKALKYFPDRIQRDDWVGQARKLSS